MSDNGLPRRPRDRDMRRIGMATTLGFGLALSLAVLIGGGVWLDQKLDMAPVFTLVGLALGVISSGYQLYELALLGQDDREKGPLGRALERRFSRKVAP